MSFLVFFRTQSNLQRFNRTQQMKFCDNLKNLDKVERLFESRACLTDIILVPLDAEDYIDFIFLQNKKRNIRKHIKIIQKCKAVDNFTILCYSLQGDNYD